MGNDDYAVKQQNRAVVLIRCHDTAVKISCCLVLSLCTDAAAL